MKSDRQSNDVIVNRSHSSATSGQDFVLECGIMHDLFFELIHKKVGVSDSYVRSTSSGSREIFFTIIFSLS